MSYNCKNFSYSHKFSLTIFLSDRSSLQQTVGAHLAGGLQLIFFFFFTNFMNF